MIYIFLFLILLKIFCIIIIEKVKKATETDDKDKIIEAKDNLLKKANEFEELMKNNQGMTIDEFKAALQERDQKQYEKWVKFTIDMGLDKLAGDVATIKDYVSAMYGKLNENQEILKAIEEAIKNHKCDCDCGDNGNHEGILGDVEDALNGLV